MNDKSGNNSSLMISSLAFEDKMNNKHKKEKKKNISMNQQDL